MKTNKSSAVASAVLTVSALFCSSTLPLQSQQDGTRHGFWFDIGVGYGLARVTCDSCSSGSRSGGRAQVLNVGWTPSGHVRLGVGAEFWTRSTGAGKIEQLTNWIASLYYYPRTRGTFSVEVGAGLSHYATLQTGWGILPSVLPDSTYVSGKGWGATIGIGWDVRAGKWMSLRPRAAYSFGSVGSVHSPNGTLAKGWKQNWLSEDVVVVLHVPHSR